MGVHKHRLQSLNNTPQFECIQNSSNAKSKQGDTTVKWWPECIILQACDGV